MFGSPKFPDASLLQLMLYGYQLKPSILLKQQLELVLNNLMRGGIRDHIHGGFHRYTSDNAWKQPHFEKMLYNQALLISVFSKAYAVFNRPEYRNVVDDTFVFLEQTFKNKNGSYYSAIDADYNGLEGRYYLFSTEELSKISPLARLQFNWNQFESSDFKLPALNKTDTPSLMAKNSLLAVKSKLKLPYIDKKMLTSWNALLVSAYLDAYISFNDQKYLSAAIKLATVLESAHDENNTLIRASFEGRSSGNAKLSDYAYTASAILKLYRITQQASHLSAAHDYYEKGAELFDKNHQGILADIGIDAGISIRLNDGELISPHVELANTGIGLKKLGKKTNNRVAVQVSAIKQGIMTNASNSYSANRLLLELKNGNFDKLQSFANGNGKVSFNIEDNKTLIFNINLADDWHINSMSPRQKNLIPTQLIARQGILSSINYPEPLLKMMRFDNSKLSLFEGKFTIQANFSGLSALGETIELSLQACNSNICLRPEKLKFFIPASPLI